MLIKLGEALEFDIKRDILTPKEALADDAIAKRFIKLAKKIKRLAPKAADFIYFHSIMMHSAESALIDQKTGEPLKNAKGESVKGYFEPFVNKKGQESVRWVSPDNIRPYKNANGDIFGEGELVKAYKRWVGRPLCKDHKSESVDGIRGIIIDTYYDPKFKRVHALCALDRKNYGDLARKVETGYANAVSMGTAVGRSVCTECGNIALTERDYCPCIKARTHYGEINLDLNPIELSLVVNGADGLAKVKQIIASMSEYVQNKTARIEELKCDRCVNPAELQDLSDSMNEIQKRLNALIGTQTIKQAGELGELNAAIKTINDLSAQLEDETDSNKKAILQTQINALKELMPPAKTTDIQPSQATVGGGVKLTDYETGAEPPSWAFGPDRRFATNKSTERGDEGANKEVRLLRSKVESMMKSFEELKTNNKENKTMNSARIKARAKARRAYWLGGEGVGDPKNLPYPKEDAEKIRNTQDKQMVGEPLETGSKDLHPGDKEKLTEVGRDGLNLSKAALEDRKLKRRAYMQGGGGVNEPQTYPKEDAEKIRDTQDKQMAEIRDLGKTDGMVPGDKEVKEKLLRAKLKARFTKSANKADAKWDFYAGDELILTASGKEIYEDDKTIDENWDYLSSAQYGKDVMAYIRSEGLDKVAVLLKGAVGEAPALPAPEAAPTPAPTPEATPAPEAAPAPEAPKDDMSEKVNSALSAMEEKISEIRDLLGGTAAGKESGLAELDVSTEAPMDKVLASVESLLDDAADELALISEAFDSKMDVAAKTKAVKLAGQALEDSQAIIAEANQTIERAKKCCGQKSVAEDMIKVRAAKRATLLAKAMEEMAKDKPEDKKEELEEKVECLTEELKDAKEELKECKEEEKSDVEVEEDDAKEGMCVHDSTQTCDFCMPSIDQQSKKEVLKAVETIPTAAPADDKPVVSVAKKTREELIAQAEAILGKYQLDLGKATGLTEPTVTQAHPGGGTVTELTGTKTPEAKVETLDEVHKVMRDVAESGPRNVREAAAELNEKIVEGKVKREDLDRLVAEGKVDAECVAYFKKYWAQADGTGSFGADLSKEFATAKKTASEDNFKVKIRRAYDIGLQAQDKGLINSTREALDSYVDEILKFDDAAFESYRRVIAGQGKAKKSGSLPVVGLEATSADLSASTTEQPVSVSDQLSVLWRK